MNSFVYVVCVTIITIHFCHLILFNPSNVLIQQHCFRTQKPQSETDSICYTSSPLNILPLPCAHHNHFYTSSLPHLSYVIVTISLFLLIRLLASLAHTLSSFFAIKSPPNGYGTSSYSWRCIHFCWHLLSFSSSLLIRFYDLLNNFTASIHRRPNICTFPSFLPHRAAMYSSWTSSKGGFAVVVAKRCCMF